VEQATASAEALTDFPQLRALAVGVRLERGVGCGIDHDHEYVREFRRFPCDPLLRAEGTAGRIGGQGRRLQGMR
jgi:hypothetical protein